MQPLLHVLRMTATELAVVAAAAAAVAPVVLAVRVGVGCLAGRCERNFEC